MSLAFRPHIALTPLILLQGYGVPVEGIANIIEHRASQVLLQWCSASKRGVLTCTNTHTTGTKYQFGKCNDFKCP
ncbi:hypothetical protein BU25DRAFT_414064 [Macroventuria anomochaeta]|uniref:Uncharacterized protein n=1 Tax=Macroventuria anomochaeta TaxID=301207 RepID=A0ACB6RR82_9PLEO|nr:uncharacterized protein BU25DRAFT_414064 [Macroventuria anomochaeta]KAF2623905.1 hypothetical protein BU25DRAFT_414064 [Macroventuria anomochaeta]